VLVAGAALFAVGIERSEPKEQLYDVTGEVFGLMKSPGVFAEGLLDGEGVFVRDMEGEVAGLAIEGWVSGDTEALGVVEDDDGILLGEAGVEPGEAAAGELDFDGADGLEGGVGGGDVAL
jgi:hypothetical protein